MHSADYAVARCLSVCPSVTRRYGYTYPQSFLRSGSPTILVFPYQTGWQYSDGDGSNGGAECKGYMKKSRFAANIGLYLATDAR